MHEELEKIQAAYRTLRAKRRAMLGAIDECRLCLEDRDTPNIEMALQRLNELEKLLNV